MQENDSPVLIFDGVCNLCNGLVTFILRNEKNTAIKFTALQYESSIALLARYGINRDKVNSIVFIEDNKTYFKSAAVFKVASFLKSPYHLIKIFKVLPSFFTDFFYDCISRVRYRLFGKRDTCIIPDEKFRSRFI